MLREGPGADLCRRRSQEDGEKKVGHAREGKCYGRAQFPGAPSGEGLWSESEAGKVGDARWPGPQSSGLSCMEQ